MLVLSRQQDEVVVILDPNTGVKVEVTVVDIRGDKVRLGFNTKRSIQIHRKEVMERIERGEEAQFQQGKDFPS